MARQHKSLPRISNLYAANGTEIPVYGTKILKLNLGLRRDFVWSFVIAEVNSPIIGSDFLTNYELLIDLKNKQLIDSKTNLKININSISSKEPTIKTYDSSSAVAHLLEEFKEITLPTLHPKPLKTGIEHYINTTGQPITSRARKLPPEKLKAARQEFEYLMQQGICRPSKSCWSSPLHMVKKPDGTWRVCGDYRALNARTQKDCYPVPYIQNMMDDLNECKVFSKVDLRKAFHQTPVRPEDIPKTAIITPFGLFEFVYMPPRLNGAAQTQQRNMDNIFRDLKFVKVFIDDMIIGSKNIEEHLQHIKVVFQRLREN